MSSTAPRAPHPMKILGDPVKISVSDLCSFEGMAEQQTDLAGHFAQPKSKSQDPSYAHMLSFPDYPQSAVDHIDIWPKDAWWPQGNPYAPVAPLGSQWNQFWHDPWTGSCFPECGYEDVNCIVSDLQDLNFVQSPQVALECFAYVPAQSGRNNSGGDDVGHCVPAHSFAGSTTTGCSTSACTSEDESAGSTSLNSISPACKSTAQTSTPSSDEEDDLVTAGQQILALITPKGLNVNSQWKSSSRASLIPDEPMSHGCKPYQIAYPPGLCSIDDSESIGPTPDIMPPPGLAIPASVHTEGTQGPTTAELSLQNSDLPLASGSDADISDPEPEASAVIGTKILAWEPDECWSTWLAEAETPIEECSRPAPQEDGSEAMHDSALLTGTSTYSDVSSKDSTGISTPLAESEEVERLLGVEDQSSCSAVKSASGPPSTRKASHRSKARSEQRRRHVKGPIRARNAHYLQAAATSTEAESTANLKTVDTANHSSLRGTSRMWHTILALGALILLAAIAVYSTGLRSAPAMPDRRETPIQVWVTVKPQQAPARMSSQSVASVAKHIEMESARGEAVAVYLKSIVQRTASSKRSSTRKRQR